MLFLLIQEDGTADPFKVVQANGKLYGRGVADDKGPLLAGYYAAKIIHDLDLPVKKKIRIIFGCDEERGSSALNITLLRIHIHLMGFTPDAEFPVVYGEKGIVRFHITGNVKKDGLIAMVAGDRVNIVPGECEAIIKVIINNMKNHLNNF